MKILRLPMGCLSSRSTVSPSGRVETNLKAVVVDGDVENNRLNETPIATIDGKIASGAVKKIKDNNTATIKDAIKISDSGTSPLPQATSSTNGQKSKSNSPEVEVQSTNSSIGSPEDDIMSILINSQENYKENLDQHSNNESKTVDSSIIHNNTGKPGDKVVVGHIREMGKTMGRSEKESKLDEGQVIGGGGGGGRSSLSGSSNLLGGGSGDMEKIAVDENGGETADEVEGRRSSTNEGDKKVEDNFDSEENLELLRQYIAIDYGITQLEDKDTLRVYHEKIEQLEQLERELDMISSEAEEVAGRSEVLGTPIERSQSISMHGSVKTNNEQKMDVESNSLASVATGSMSHKSWTTVSRQPNPQQQQQQQQLQQQVDNSSNQSATGGVNNKPGSRQTTVAHSTASRKGAAAHKAASDATSRKRFNHHHHNNHHHHQGFNVHSNNNLDNDNNLSYLTVGEVFNRKIILEKERDKLKKEVEVVIVECDRLQQLYKRRDEILDRLFDGRTGNGLENHLEQQLNWLLEQKHYVDQVFYAWKRAETLTSQTCEQFASASELLKRLPKVEDNQQREELSQNISQLLIKSRKDMEQAQKYNPNVDAPFFTENETERFDKIIETISSNSINSNDYSQILTVIQFAYKRAVSIRLWLEQILQTTIARDSFELAEEYKWIAIQLRKERINLIKSKLQNAPYQTMVQTIQEQLARQQTLVDRRQQHEINRDSGVESETNDIDIEEEIYRLLELNKSRLEAFPQQQQQQQQQQAPSSANQPYASSQYGRVAGAAAAAAANAVERQLNTSDKKADSSRMQQQNDLANNRDEIMRYRVERRLTGEQPLHLSQVPTGEAQVAPPDEQRTSSPVSNRLQQQQQRLATVTVARESAGSVSNNSLASVQTPTKLRIELDEEARQNLLKQVDQVHNRHRSRIERLRGKNRAKLVSNNTTEAVVSERVESASSIVKTRDNNDDDDATSTSTSTATATANVLTETKSSKLAAKTAASDTAADTSAVGGSNSNSKTDKTGTERLQQLRQTPSSSSPPHQNGSDAAKIDNSYSVAITGSN